MIPRARRGALAALAAAALAGSSPGAAARVIPPSVLPGLGAGSARVPVDMERAPWREVVRVQTEVGARCTGALVGPRSVLTAAHCLFGRGTGRLVRPSSVHVLAGYDRGGLAGHGRGVSLEIGPGFGMGPDNQRLPAASPQADWAVITLDTPLGTPDRVLPLLRPTPAPNTPAMLGGFEQDRMEIVLADVDCRIVGLAQDAAGHVLLRHSCAATRGVSGAPLLARTQSGSWGIAGVASLAPAGAAGGYAVPAAVIDPATINLPR